MDRKKAGYLLLTATIVAVFAAFSFVIREEGIARSREDVETREARNRRAEVEATRTRERVMACVAAGMRPKRIASEGAAACVAADGTLREVPGTP